MNNEIPKGFYIPPNYKNGISVFGKTYPASLITQGSALVIAPWIIVFLVFPNIGLNIGWSVGSVICIFMSVIFGYLGLNGINGYSLLQFMKSYGYFRTHRRICYYNPRIKTEARPSSMQNEAEQILPREKLEKIWKNYQNTIAEKNRNAAVRAQNEFIDDRENLYFADDIGIVEKPVEYMTGKEYRKYQKELRKKARDERRAAKSAERERRKEEKRRAKTETAGSEEKKDR